MKVQKQNLKFTKIYAGENEKSSHMEMQMIMIRI